jgi:hypothetical protein
MMPPTPSPSQDLAPPFSAPTFRMSTMWEVSLDDSLELDHSFLDFHSELPTRDGDGIEVAKYPVSLDLDPSDAYLSPANLASGPSELESSSSSDLDRLTTISNESSLTTAKDLIGFLRESGQPGTLSLPEMVTSPRSISTENPEDTQSSPQQLTATAKTTPDEVVPSEASPQSCACLSDLATLLETLSNRSSSLQSQALDSILAYQKYVLDRCNTMLGCKSCSAKSNNSMLFAIVADKLVEVGGETARRYQSILKDDRSKETDIPRMMAQESSRFLGACPLTKEEHFELCGSLLILHLRACRTMLKRIRETTHSVGGNAQTNLLVAAEQKTTALIVGLCEMI